MVHHLRRAILAGVLGVLVAVPAASAAPPPRDLARTFPAASSLCDRVAADRAPRRLRGHEADVLAACTSLRTAFDAAQAAFAARYDEIDAQAQAARAALEQACQSGPRAACRAARAQFASALFDARVQLLRARLAERQGLAAAADAFWTAIDDIASGTATTPPPPPPPVDPPVEPPLIIS